ncbi:DUF951 domain-containing protein [Clostridium formicaceticum]|uniref:DUF951 domain-containing protein n=1 Tax=Clostridium formicaceticum TaxID=1497 RepID=A0AAC9RHR8_9CLOT|nr:DUF951 domain-containing protein [Clostridium formicaceticum]AOY75435.1 DUF951 domain-containing protein [Clostridium formicaceticum]ARE85720.1 hypothetical protein CLFO_00330 [Clostridium formicaceticum]
MPMDLKVGDIVELKKQHPCGSNHFEIIRTGADFRIKCTGCERQLWIARPNLERRIKKVTSKSE